MTAIQYQILNNEEFSGATIYVPGEEPQTIASSHPSYEKIVQLLISGSEDVEAIQALAAPAQAVSKVFKRLSDRFGYRSGSLLFDGEPLAGALADHIIKIIENDGTETDYSNFVKFAEKLYTNPSKDSIEHLFAFISKHGISITDDGDFIAFKGVRHDGKSSHAGYGIVDGVEFEHANLQNDVGSIIEVPRSKVDPDRNVACSVGLHVGSFAYASSFAPRLLRAKVNPRDVVSVPSDHQDAKIRVSRYEVVEESAEDYKAPSYTVINIIAPVVEGNVPETPADDDDTELSDDEVYFNRKVEEFVGRIPELTRAGIPLKRYRNKNITAKGRLAFDEAVKQLGLSY